MTLLLQRTRSGLSPPFPSNLAHVLLFKTVAGEHADSGGVKTNGEGSSKKKKKVEKGLFDVQWKVCLSLLFSFSSMFTLVSQRIILDEGHTIRNPKTKMAKAVSALVAQRRWVLSGTPIVSTILAMKE